MPNTRSFLTVFRDCPLLCILVLGLGLRVYQMADPLVDLDSIRQGATASIARNYYEFGYNLFDPRITGWGTINEPTLWANEFPLYPYVISWFYRLFGVHEWFGRLLTALFCLAGAAALFDIVRRFEGTLTARFAALWFLIAPQAIYHGRCFHRHPVALSLMLLAIVFYLAWLERRQWSAYIAMTIHGMLALLMMPPLIFISVPIFLLHRKVCDRVFWKNGWLWLSIGIMLLPCLLWYGWAIQQHSSWSLRTINREGFRDWTNPSYYMLWWKHDLFRTIWKSLWAYTMGPVGLTFACVGLFLRKGKAAYIPLIWTLTIIVYYALDIHPIAIVPHYIYFLFLLPPLAWAAARVCSACWDLFRVPSIIPKISLNYLFTGIFIFATLFYWDWTFRSWYQTKNHWIRAAKTIDEMIPEDAKLVVDVFDPSFIYYTKRMGLAKDPGQITLEKLQEWESQGATHLAIINQQAFFPKGELRMYLKETARNVIINSTVRLYELGGKKKNDDESIDSSKE